MTRRITDKTRAPEYNRTAEVLSPADERMSIEQMLLGYTINGARQLGIEASKGSIEVGKDADFLICAAEAAREIATAKQPVAIVGGGVISAGASAEVMAFVEKYHLPVAHTLMGLGAIPRSHPQSLGFAGMYSLPNSLAIFSLACACASVEIRKESVLM